MKKTENKKKKLKVMLVVDIFLLLIIAGFVYFFYMASKTQLDKSQDKTIVTNEVKNEKLTGYRNIVLFGVDSRSNALEKTTHSDTIIIVSINRKTKDIKLASVYRDTYVNIPGKGYDKINAAYFRGGYPLALSTINTNFDLDIKEFMTVNFNAVCKVIDLLGGITLDISPEELKYVNGYTKELNKINGTNVGNLESSGTQLVNGTHATAYARIRYTSGGDFKRTERQRIVVEKIFEKAKKTDFVTLNKIFNEMLPQIYTNLDSLDLLSLGKDILSYHIVDETGFPFDKTAEYYQKVSYVFPIDLAANVTQLHKFLFNKEDYTPTDTVTKYSDEIKKITGK